MNEVTANNFQQLYPKVENALKNATFFGVDLEFSGLHAGEGVQYSLFDTMEKRYVRLKANLERFIGIQFGLTAFHYVRDENKYTAESFNFFLVPRSIPTKNRQFTCQAAAIEFLCSYEFDFNKCFYEGISYLNEIDEAELCNQLKTNSNLCYEEQFLSYKDENELKVHSFQIFEWLQTNPKDPIVIHTSTPILQYLLQKELRNQFPNIWTYAGDRKVTVLKVEKDVRISLQEKEEHNIEQVFLDYYIGFSKVFKLLINLKKPIVGHNVLLDLMLMHHQFYKPLPKRYSEFKKNIHQLFPTIYDTKFISYEMKNLVDKEVLWKLNALSVLYTHFKDGKGRHSTLQSPFIELKEKTVADKEKYHEAGWDSYCAGFCFIRLAHLFAVNSLGKGSDLRPLTNIEIMSGVKNYANCVNVMRGIVTHMKLDGPDPEQKRIKWLHVQSLGREALNISEIAETFSTYGAMDVKLCTPERAVIAVSNQSRRISCNDAMKKQETGSQYVHLRYPSPNHSVITVIHVERISIEGNTMDSTPCSKD
ncbi:pre-piRNA 3'-exonuclease trimmer isoform X2 [Cephus cinctus]|uniref:Pre-piRNA 3'-exonuclease trimmer isoform X2 n=1 Tax=Cephus cinctus TaxID=211228 RepID=A0AAJ7C6M3_CEPCN|nr:pre-piRNA 3'-exonuclease trimmer isoform X2 [Cephus cinctus]XP_024944137.1 pre-piRNA 3'-exonuclease trimmer isoform X2 [Cephus cinctus]